MTAFWLSLKFISLPIKQQIYIYFCFISSEVSVLLKSGVIAQVEPEATAVSTGDLEPKFPNVDFECTVCPVLPLFHSLEKHVSLTPLTGYVFQSSSPSTVVVSSRTTEGDPQGGGGVERERVMWEGAEKQGECERRTAWAPRVTAQSGVAEMGTGKVRMGWGGGVYTKRKRNGDEKIGREQTILIKLSMRSRRSCKALIWFTHHEIRALRRSTRQRLHRRRHALRLSAGSREHWCFPFLEVRTL